MFTPTERRPYITCISEMKLYEKSRELVDDIRLDKRQDYRQFKQVTRKMVSSHIKNGFSLEDECNFLCNEALGAIASEGVTYLMYFIFLGLITKEHNQKINFIEIELQYINEEHLLKQLKHRINDESYSEMEKDLKNALSFYKIEENDFSMEHPANLLSDKDIKKFYDDLKVYAFYYQIIEELHISYNNFLKISQETMDYDEAVKCAISQTINFEYYDSRPLIDQCEPARIYIVMAIAKFLLEIGASKKYLTQEMKNELESILKNKKVRKFKRYFSKSDYEELTKDERVFRKWYEN